MTATVPSPAVAAAAAGGLLGSPLGVPTSAAGVVGAPGAPTPSLYEMAALTHELDTQAVTTKVKEILLANNVGQKVRKEINGFKFHLFHRFFFFSSCLVRLFLDSLRGQ